MKRTSKRVDGTEEVLEGTAEELAEYERKLNRQEQREQKGGKPHVLRGKELDDIFDKLEKSERFEELLKRVAKAAPTLEPTLPYWPSCRPIWIVSCSICGKVGCDGHHWPSLLPRTIMIAPNPVGWSSDKVFVTTPLLIDHKIDS